MENAVLSPLLDAHKDNISQYTRLDAQLQAAEGDLEKAITSFMETSEDETAVKLREAMAEASRRLRTLAEANVKTEEISDEDKEKLRTELSALKDTIRNGRRALQKVAETFGLDINEALSKLGDPTKGSSSTGEKTGSSLPRVSVNVTVYNDVKPDVKVEFDSLGKAADHIGVAVEDMQKYFAQAAGVEHENIKTVKTDQKFTVPRQANSNVTWTVETTPKETKPRGRQVVKPGDDGESESTESTESTEESTEAA